jgi:hypothetical protein
METVTRRVKADTNCAGHQPGDLVELTPAQAIAWADRFEPVEPLEPIIVALQAARDAARDAAAATAQARQDAAAAELFAAAEWDESDYLSNPDLDARRRP